jgi:hypothetical protein
VSAKRSPHYLSELMLLRLSLLGPVKASYGFASDGDHGGFLPRWFHFASLIPVAHSVLSLETADPIFGVSVGRPARLTPGPASRVLALRRCACDLLCSPRFDSIPAARRIDLTILRVPTRTTHHPFSRRHCGVTSSSRHIACASTSLARDRPLAPKQSADVGHYGRTRHDRPGPRLLGRIGHLS